MTRKITSNLQNKYKNIALLTQCLLLFFKNLFLIKTLKFKSLSLYDKVVIQGNEIEIIWNVTGCHKIKIEGVGVVSGNTHGIKFIFSNRINPIEITFFGVANKIKKRMPIENTKITLIQKFISNIEIPIANIVPFNKQTFESNLSKDKLKIELQNIYFEFDNFAIENYKPANRI